MSEDLPPFPKAGEDEPEERDNVIFVDFPQAEEEPEAEPEYTLSELRQLALSEEILAALNKYSGDFAVLGAMVRRFEIEKTLGPVTEEEFIFISGYITSLILRSYTPILHLLVAEGRELYNN